MAAAVDPAAVAADSASPPADRLLLLGAPLDPILQEEVERRIVTHLASGDASLFHIVTLNPEYVVAARDSEEFHEAIARADCSIADGVGVVLAARLLTGQQLRRTTGVELASRILDGPTEESVRVFLLGAPGSVAALQGRHPTRVVGRWGSGSAGPVDDIESIERIREREATVVLVGYGAPGQVLWIERNRQALAVSGVRVAIGVGGALDYLAEEVPRAPRIVRSAGLEWAYRLMRRTVALATAVGASSIRFCSSPPRGSDNGK